MASRTLRLLCDFKYSDTLSVEEFLSSSSSALGKADLSIPLKILSDHWCDTVSDLRLLMSEALLYQIGLPLRLCQWIEQNLIAFNNPPLGNTQIIPAIHTPPYPPPTQEINNNNNNTNNNINNTMVSPSSSSSSSNTAPISTSSSSSSLSAMATLNSSPSSDTSSSSSSLLLSSSSSLFNHPSLRPQFFAYVNDFDENGVIYYLGTSGGKQSFDNPASIDHGPVSVSCSGLMKDSLPAYHSIGRSIVRCVTSSEAGSYFALHFRDRLFQCSAYTLRHYSSWDTECIRDWRFEGSRDGINWIVLSIHVADDAIKGKGASHTWKLSLPVSECKDDDPNITALKHYFRSFRVILTGPNSNNHLYLPLSGWEMYGAMITKEEYQNALQSLSPSIAASFNYSLINNNSSSAASSSVPTLPIASAVAAVAPSMPRVPSSARLIQPSSRYHEFIYVSDFDTNGILYALGTNFGTIDWRNPADAGLVVCDASSIMEDSVKVNAIVGRSVVRCVTKPQANSWFSLDLIDKKIIVSHYTLRHYSTWDSEAIRYWRFEGSNDFINWTIIREHINDESINGKGASYTWSISDWTRLSAYRYFRIYQTGENSNKHLYLPLSGMELYGKLYQSDGITPYVPNSLPSSIIVGNNNNNNISKDAILEFRHQRDFDDGGIIHWIGTKEHSAPWSNPAIAQLISVNPSSLTDDSAPAPAVVGRDVVRCVTQPIADSYFIIDLKNYSVCPNAYTLRHYSSWDTEALRNWRFEGSNDSINWIIIREHREDSALEGKGATHTWTLTGGDNNNNNNNNYYRYFRIFQYGTNSNKHHYLACSGFELYGLVKRIDPIGNNPSPPPSIPLPSPSSSPVVLSSASAAVASLSSSSNNNSSSSILCHWDPDHHGNFITINNGVVCNSGSSDKWQMARSVECFSSGIIKTAIKITNDTSTTNTWRFIVGVIPASLDVKGPKQWVGTGGSWGYIGGTGGKAHGAAASVPYGAKFGNGDIIGFVLNFDAGTIEFYRNNEYQGIAFNDLKEPVHIAVSMTAADAAIEFTSFPSSASSISLWDVNNKSQHLIIDDNGAVRNEGSNDKWQAIRSIKSFSSIPGKKNRYSFEVEIIDAPKTPNSWQIIVGVVPASFNCSGAKQWVGASESYGYIGGTGGKCYNDPKAVPYGDKFGKGDIIGTVIDFDAGTIEFIKNGISQGIAFENINNGPLHAAVSVTATGATARLRLLSS